MTEEMSKPKFMGGAKEVSYAPMIPVYAPRLQSTSYVPHMPAYVACGSGPQCTQHVYYDAYMPIWRQGAPALPILLQFPQAFVVKSVAL